MHTSCVSESFYGVGQRLRFFLHKIWEGCVIIAFFRALLTFPIDPFQGCLLNYRSPSRSFPREPPGCRFTYSTGVILIGWIREDLFRDYPKFPVISFVDKELALSLFYEVIQREGISVLTRKAKLIQLIDLLIKDNFPNFFEQNDHFLPIEKQVKEYLDSNQGFTARLDDLAKHFNYNKYYLDHCFQKRYHIGIIAYRNQRRMLIAKELLQYDSATAVSEQLGFSSIYAFSRAFKNHFGITPSDLKKEYNKGR